MFDHVKLSSFGLSQHSPNRLHNEDRYLITERFFAVADGMGGHNAGEVASQSALSFLQSKLEGLLHSRFSLEDLTSKFIDHIQATNTHLLEISESKPFLEGMGTTLATVLFDGRFVIHAHLGDSRLYRLRAGKLDLLTVDHTAYRDDLTKKRALLTEKHVLTKALGTLSTVQPTIGYQVAFPKDRYLLCTDGLSDVLADDEIKKYLTNPSLQTACEELIQAAKVSGSQDDITTLLIQVEFPNPPRV